MSTLPKFVQLQIKIVFSPNWPESRFEQFRCDNLEMTLTFVVQENFHLSILSASQQQFMAEIIIGILICKICFVINSFKKAPIKRGKAHDLW